jgi:hypothetical protein
MFRQRGFFSVLKKCSRSFQSLKGQSFLKLKIRPREALPMPIRPSLNSILKLFR